MQQPIDKKSEEISEGKNSLPAQEDNIRFIPLEKYLIFRHFSDKTKAQVAPWIRKLSFVPLLPEHGQSLVILNQLLPILEKHPDLLADEGIDPNADYGEWLGQILQLIKLISPWIFAGMTDGKPDGVMWVSNWEHYGERLHSVEFSGIHRPKSPPAKAKAALYLFLTKLFNETDVYIIRSEMAEDNRAARLALMSLGFSNPETRRGWKIRNGKEITGKILSITRPEWEAFHGKIQQE